MPIVRMPDGTQVSFPDDMPQEQIRSLIQTKFPQETAPKEQGILEKAHTYLDPVRVLAGKAGDEKPSTLMDYVNAALFALPAGKGPTLAPEASQLHAAGGAGYKLGRMSPVALDGTKVSTFSANLKTGLRKDGFYPTNAPGTHQILDDLGQGKTFFTNGQFTVDDYIAARQALQKQAQTFSAPQDQKAATVAIERLDNLFDKTSHRNFVGGTPTEIDEVRASIKDARANFAAGYRSDLLTNKQHRAELQTAATNSGMNLDNKLRQTTAGILTSPKSVQGFNPAETAQMEQIVKGVPGANATRFAGNLMGGGGGLGAVVSAGIPGAGLAALAHSPTAALAGMSVPAAGYGLKLVENALTKSAMERLANATRLRSPLGSTATPGPYSQNALAIKLMSLMPYLAEQP